MEAVLSPVSKPFSRSGRQIAWSAYIRMWVRAALPGVLYDWQATARHIPQFSIADSVLTENATETSTYFVVWCKL
jgi:hypothetical protein